MPVLSLVGAASALGVVIGLGGSPPRHISRPRGAPLLCVATEPIRLLPLCAVVPFPQAPAYLVSVSSDDAAHVPDGQLVGLLPRAEHGGLRRVGVLARAGHAVTGGTVLACEPRSRFSLASDAAEQGGALSGLTEPFDDDVLAGEEAAEATSMCETLWRQCGELDRLCSDAQGEAVDTNAALRQVHSFRSDPCTFSLALAGILEIEAAEALTLLESRSTLERLRALDDLLRESLSFAAAKASLRRLML